MDIFKILLSFEVYSYVIGGFDGGGGDGRGDIGFFLDFWFEYLFIH
jgi:hypothetical protein